MRTLLALALALVACGGSDRDDALPRDARPSPTPQGPDPIVMRVPRAGGQATAYVYPRLDSLVWTSQARLPALARVLAVNTDEGLVAFVGQDSVPGRLDLRMGTVTRAGRTRLRDMESVDAEAIFGIAADGKVVRLTPSGEPWSLTPPRPARSVIPQLDGWLLVVADSADRTLVWRLHPPERRLVDTLSLPSGERAVRTRVGDRVYFAAGDRLTGVRAQGLQPVPGHDFDAPVSAVTTTPSGDRVFVLTDSSPVLAVVDRYQERIVDRVELPGVGRDLRVDPLGRYLLVRPMRGDSAWVVSVSDGALLGTVRSSWRVDVPFVAPDGRVAVVRGADVVFVDPQTLAETGRVAGGASDHWIQFPWNGFRPRAEGLDAPVEFRTPPPPVEPEPVDSTLVTGVDSAASPFGPPTDSARGGRPARPAPRAPAAQPAGFPVSFAALLDEGRARALAGEIEVGGQRARVAVGQRAGVPIYRVVLGPYPTRADADRVGQESGRQYFVIEGNP
ncbi:MAG TPA: SPOR domain-containing protein [Gemmatimonadaceae bacterium]|nr:SPOR domain-containing protein [Gemmatimonadaceae bacterium]